MFHLRCYIFGSGKIKELTDELEGYVKDINGGKSFDDVDAAYNEKHELAQSSAVSNIEQLENFSAGDELKKAYEELGSGKATTVKVGEGDTAMLYLVYKRDIKETAKTYFESAQNRSSVLSAMKTDDFKKYVEDLAKDLEHEKNDGAVNRYDPKMFFVAEEPTTAAAETTVSADVQTDEEATASAE